MRPILGRSLLVVALASAACRTMKSVRLDELKAMNVDRAWVTERDQSVVVMYVPQVVGDTLAGYVNGQLKQLPRTELKQVTVRRPAPMRTALLVAGITVGVGGLLATLSGSGNPPIPTSLTGPPGQCDKNPEDPVCVGQP